MLGLFYKIEKISSLIPIRKIRSLNWKIIKFFTNFIYKYYVKLYPLKINDKQKIIDGQVIVSMTTFPDRLPTISLVLESLFRQTIMPDRIILWLAVDQFPDKCFVESFFKKYINLGLEIGFCDDLRSHKKYYYTMKENPDAYVVTVDDDILYAEDMLEKLLKTYILYPNCIITNRAHEITYDENGDIEAYGKWNWLAKNVKGPSLNLFATGGAGCLYFPGSLSEHTLDKVAIKKYCLYADDVWLKCMAMLKKRQIVLSDINNPEIIDVFDNKDNGLANINVINNKNDEQLKLVSDFYNIDWRNNNEFNK